MFATEQFRYSTPTRVRQDELSNAKICPGAPPRPKKIPKTPERSIIHSNSNLNSKCPGAPMKSRKNSN